LPLRKEDVLVSRIGPFKIESVLSRSGGMGIVYKASFYKDKDYPERNSKLVALKVARAQGPYASVFEQLLRQEIQTLNDLRHPGVVRVFPIAGRRRYIGRAVEIDGDNPPYYFAMELLDNTSVERIITENRFSLSWRIELIYQIAVILDYLHLRSFAHQDLKPENILFRTPPHPNQPPQPVLIDFGLTGKRDQNREHISAMTLMYASPERIHTVRQGKRTAMNLDRMAVDIWALGVIAYELLNRRYPFKENGSQSILADKIVNQFPDPMNDDIPKEVQQIIMGMLHKDPTRRLPIEEVTQALETDIELISPRI
jgi:serine/threonine protein kinase